jgi:hypothetical protein
MFGFLFGGDTSEGSWTGLLCDQDSMKSISTQIDPEGYLENYPKGKASNLNTMFQGFVLYHHRQWFVLDKKGSELAKQLIARSKSSNGFKVTVQGRRKGNKIIVTGVFDCYQAPAYAVSKGSQNRQIRGEFSRMGI